MQTQAADSTNAAQNAGDRTRFGMYPNPLASERANDIADRIEMHNSAPVFRPFEVTQEALLFA